MSRLAFNALLFFNFIPTIGDAHCLVLYDTEQPSITINPYILDLAFTQQIAVKFSA
jgi:hypothetical protein